MANNPSLEKVAHSLKDAVELGEGPSLVVNDLSTVRDNIEDLVRKSIFGDPSERGAARWLVREIALHAGIVPTSIHEFYLARGRGEIRDDFTVPAMNLRSLPFFAAKAVFRACMGVEGKAIIFELARSEMGYTAQPPAEYAANVLGAAIAQGYQGPIFLQGDHFQASAKKYSTDPEAEIGAIQTLAKNSIQAGFFNIDIDTSTLVDLSKETLPEQQATNYQRCAQLAAFIRSVEPYGVTTSLGGEIGEVGGHNSTEPELRAFMDGFLKSFNESAPGEEGLSKISIQTGTSHGGVVLPDGSIAEVKVDFETLQQLSAIAKTYGMGGAVQHGASTLPQEAFSRFVEANALEVHLATNFQNILYEHIPDNLREEIHTYLRENHSDERKPDQTEEQFYYKTRKRALGPFKEAIWEMPLEYREPIEEAWEEQFGLLFERLNIAGTQGEVDKFVKPIPIHEPFSSYIGETAPEEDTRDLAD
jgi:fructose/tagatose bisphosphate aldolase